MYGLYLCIFLLQEKIVAPKDIVEPEGDDEEEEEEEEAEEEGDNVEEAQELLDAIKENMEQNAGQQ